MLPFFHVTAPDGTRRRRYPFEGESTATLASWLAWVGAQPPHEEPAEQADRDEMRGYVRAELDRRAAEDARVQTAGCAS